MSEPILITYNGLNFDYFDGVPRQEVYAPLGGDRYLRVQLTRRERTPAEVSRGLAAGQVVAERAEVVSGRTATGWRSVHPFPGAVELQQDAAGGFEPPAFVPRPTPSSIQSLYALPGQDRNKQ